MDQTNKHRVLNNHIRHKSGASKTVCVSACLSFFGIHPDKYSYTSSLRTINSYEGVMRRHGYGLRSRKSEFKVQKYNKTTMTALRKAIKASKYTRDDFFLVSGVQRKAGHLMVLNGMGETIIDTAKGKRWRIRSVKQVLT